MLGSSRETFHEPVREAAAAAGGVVAGAAVFAGSAFSRVAIHSPAGLPAALAVPFSVSPSSVAVSSMAIGPFWPAIENQIDTALSFCSASMFDSPICELIVPVILAPVLVILICAGISPLAVVNVAFQVPITSAAAVEAAGAGVC